MAVPMIDRDQIEAATERYNARARRRQRNERLIRERRWLEVDTPERVRQFLQRRPGARTGEELCTPSRVLPPAVEAAPQLPPQAALERMIGANDLIGVAFLERGLQVARSVGRIWVAVASGQPAAFGTGFLIAPRLLLTNHHVLEDAAQARNSLVEFDYQLGVDGAPTPTHTFQLDPSLFFVTDQALDFTITGIASRGQPDATLDGYLWNPLIADQGKVILSQWMNIIQHPSGEPKQLSFRENQLVDILDDFLHYKTDTAPGSSGSPVFNDRWEVVGLHHSGVWETDAQGHIIATDGSVWRSEMGEERIRWIANEGVRISRIIANVRAQPLDPERRALFEATLTEAAPVNTPRSMPALAQTTGGTFLQSDQASDGSVSLTIPLTLTLRLGGVLTGPPATPGPQQPASPPAAKTDQKTGTVEEVLEAARKELRGRADVIDVQLGYLFRNGWITNERAIVVTVRDKKAPVALRESRIPGLPDTVMGLPVEVTSPSLSDLIRLTQGDAVGREAFPLGPGPSREEIRYQPPTGAALKKVTDRLRVCAHVSPDAGWTQLHDFLGKTKSKLSVAMYDFGAPHIEQAVLSLAKARGMKHVTLVMQRGESVGRGTKADDLTDEEVVTDLEKAFKAKFENAWVKIGRVNGWVSSSYHIKVAVRDSAALWLSSGNWQSSNQPDANPLAERPPQRKWLDQYNRDWHAIVEHAGLAKTYEAFIQHDYDNNVAAEGMEALQLPDLLIPAGFLLPLEAARPFKYFAPYDKTRRFTVTPLLTPDNYHEAVLNVVRGAQRELLIQNQTFKAPGPDHVKLKELIDATMQRIDAGVDVRVIFRILMPKDARDTLTALKDYGFPTDRIKVQKNCHTKGIIADRQRVVLGSQNWSNDGVSVNRDASLLFEDAELAEYFSGIFDHDWNNQASQSIGPERGGARIATRDEVTPAGMVRLSWKDYMEMQ